MTIAISVKENQPDSMLENCFGKAKHHFCLIKEGKLIINYLENPGFTESDKVGAKGSSNGRIKIKHLIIK